MSNNIGLDEKVLASIQAKINQNDQAFIGAVKVKINEIAIICKQIEEECSQKYRVSASSLKIKYTYTNK